MANTIKTGTILIREGALLPESSLIESEPYAPGWNLVKRLDIDGMSQTIGKAGWAFLYMAGVIRTSVFGFDEEKTTRKAIKRVIEHMRSKKFRLFGNCCEMPQDIVVITNNHHRGRRNANSDRAVVESSRHSSPER
jgi:hypothetical protein